MVDGQAVLDSNKALLGQQARFNYLSRDSYRSPPLQSPLPPRPLPARIHGHAHRSCRACDVVVERRLSGLKQRLISLQEAGLVRMLLEEGQQHVFTDWPPAGADCDD